MARQFGPWGKTLRHLGPNCPLDTSALVPKCPGSSDPPNQCRSVLRPKCLDPRWAAGILVNEWEDQTWMHALNTADDLSTSDKNLVKLWLRLSVAVQCIGCWSPKWTEVWPLNVQHCWLIPHILSRLCNARLSDSRCNRSTVYISVDTWWKRQVIAFSGICEREGERHVITYT